MMTRQSMARVSSASPEADFAPATQTPFNWEAAPGRAAKKSTKYGNSENFASADRDSSDADEGPSLPLPPGRRPKDGFFLPYSREFGESPDLQSKVELESGVNFPRPRKVFNLKFPGSAKKPSSISRMRLPFQRSSKPPKARGESHVNEDPGFSIFNPLSGQRFGSSVANRMLMQFQKKQSLWRRCLPSKLEGSEHFRDSSSHMDPNRGRRLDEGLDEGYVTAADSLPSFPRHFHRPSSNSSPIATKPLQANSSRFMASMLISLCPDDAGGSDGAHFHAEDENSDDYNDEIGIPHTTSPTTKSSSPEAFEVEMDPASQTGTSQENFTCICKHRAYIFAQVDSSTPQDYQRGKTSRSVTRSLQEKLATARSPSENSSSEKIVQQGSRGTESSANKFNENNATDQKDIADAYPVFFKTSSNRELSRRTETFYWKPCTEKSCSNQEPVADFVALDTAQESKDSEFAEEPIFDDDGEEYDRRERDNPWAQNFPTGSNRSSSPEFSLRKPAWPGLKSSRTSITKEVHVPVSKSKNGVSHSMAGYLSPPRMSFEDLEHTTNSDIKPKAFARWRSTAEQSVLRSDSNLEAGGSERKQPPATRVALNSVSPLQKQALQRRSMPSKIRIKDLQKTGNFSSRSSKVLHPLDTDDTDESSDESDYSVDSSESETPSAAPSPVRPNFALPKPASPVLSEKLFKFNLHGQQSQRESTRSSPFMVDEETSLPGPSSEQIMMARSHSVRSSSSRRFSAPEFQEISAAGPNFKRSNHPVPASRFAKMSSSSVMNKVALFESKASVSKSGPLCSSYT